MTPLGVQGRRPRSSRARRPALAVVRPSMTAATASWVACWGRWSAFGGDVHGAGRVVADQDGRKAGHAPADRGPGDVFGDPGNGCPGRSGRRRSWWS